VQIETPAEEEQKMMFLANGAEVQVSDLSSWFKEIVNRMKSANCFLSGMA
jgi:hypothetical protein